MVLEIMENYVFVEMCIQLWSIFGVFMFSGEDVDKKVFVFLGGECVCFVLVCLLLCFFNLLVFDELINYLDIIFKDVFK